jgi:hypothetical protein
MTIYIFNTILHGTVINFNLSWLFTVSAVPVLGHVHLVAVGCVVDVLEEMCYFQTKVRTNVC